MNLLLVQHGQARDKTEDPSRSLSETGIKNAGKMAKQLCETGITVTEIRHSGKARAEQTAEIFAKHLPPQNGVSKADGLNPKDDVAKTAEILINDPSTPIAMSTLMLVGHLPFMSRLAG